MSGKLLNCLIILAALFVLSCSKSTKPSESYILINNLSSGMAWLSFDGETTVEVEANSYYKWYYENSGKAENPDSLSFAYDGDYLLPNERTVHFSKGEVASTDLVPDCCRLKITNLTASQASAVVYREEQQIGDFQLDTDMFVTMKVGQFTEDDSIRVNFDGRYVFSNSDILPLQMDATITCNIIPDAGSLLIVNSSSYTIYGVYLQPNGSQDMGENLINMPFWYGDYRIIKLHPQSGTVLIQTGESTFLQYYYTDINLNETTTIVVQ
jgi:hypothetical protein